jgi:hippurate hydrolase
LRTGILPTGVQAGVSDDLTTWLVGLRHDLHRRPELAFEEHETCRRLRAELETLRPAEIVPVGETGLVARFRGASPDVPPVAVRGDVDGLPIQEETGAPFASEIPGRMHACGHDVHACWAVGAGALLAAQPAAGDVLVVLQPAEEMGRGAERVLASGALDGVRAIFGGHVDLRFPVGRAVAQPGPLAASADSFEIQLHGAGAHGARPHEGRDPIVGGAAIVAALQTIVSRRIAPGEPAVVTVATFEAGTASNVIPARARMSGTLRAVDPEIRRRLAGEVERLAGAVGKAHGLEVRFALDRGTPPLVNTSREAEWAARAVRRVLGDDAVRPLGATNMAGEDFAFYLEKIPGCFLRIGARRPEEEPVSAHSPRFLPADESVVVGAAVLAEVARVASEGLAGAGG